MNEAKDQVPEWAMAEAASLRSAVVWQSNAANETIARALLAAERRGIERAAAKADEVATNPPGEWFARVGEDKAYSCGAMDCSHAIRRLGDTP
ncbi:hypothetical protein A3840_06810 [Devosia elaeis]|uniref:Uncharacterized protein n=1 Tax=Devosia elaeis TaxID=1770058 RepID=A0A178I1Y5_9HYPH|nr:hypothetical protein A3840_06810 [Devosia elaeis]